MKHASGYWTLERCAEVASQFSSRSEFGKLRRSVYTTAHRHGWLDQICAHMTPLMKPKGYWTKERCIEAAKKYETRHAFQKGNISAYSTASQRGWLDDVCSHMRWDNRPNGYWTVERIALAAMPFSSRKAFMEGADGAYSAAHRLGILDDVCSHMAGRGNQQKRFVYVIRNRALNIGYIGLAMNPAERYEQHKKSGRHKSLFESEHELVVLSPLLSARSASDLERKLIKEYRAEGWTLLNRAAGGGLGGSQLIWTKEKVFECGLKCATRKELLERFETAYSTAKRSGWLDEIFANHPLQGFSQQWTLERHLRAQSRAA